MRSSIPTAALTPYIVPPEAGGVVPNLGDGLILRAIERLVGPFRADRLFTTRVAPREVELNILRRSGLVIIAGANQLNDSYTIWPGMTSEFLFSNATLRFVPFGIGLDGLPDRNVCLSRETSEILELVHQRIAYSSWRCPRTVAVLRRDLPHLSDRFLMTGCPVVFDSPLLDESRFSDSERSIAVTVTDRGKFWERETMLLERVARLFPRAKRTLVVHEDRAPATLSEKVLGPLPLTGRLFKKRTRLRIRARKLGYDVVAPISADDGIRFYSGIDLHIGSRLHAHLYFLSQNKRSFLIPVDGRSLGFSEFLGFPLCDAGSIDEHFGFDFETVRERARETFATMQMFVDSLGMA